MLLGGKEQTVAELPDAKKNTFLVIFCALLTSVLASVLAGVLASRDTSHEQGHHYRFVESTHSASYSEWDNDKAWSSQEWKSDELMDDTTVKPVVCPRRGAHAFQSRPQ